MSLVTLRRLRPSAFCGSLDEEPRAETARRCGRRSRPRGFRGDRDRTDVPAPPRFLLSAAQGQNAPVLPLAGAGESDRGRRRRPTRHRSGRSGLRWRGGRSRICTSGPAAPRRAHCRSACRPACFPIRTRARERGAAGLTGSSHGGGAWRSVADGGRTPTRSSASLWEPLRSCPCDMIHRETQLAGRRAGRDSVAPGAVASSSGHRLLSASCPPNPGTGGCQERQRRSSPPAARGGLGVTRGTGCGARLLCALLSRPVKPPTHAP